jgi:hypothetical protein
MASWPGPDGSRSRALAQLWRTALAAFKEWAESRPPGYPGPGPPPQTVPERTDIQAIAYRPCEKDGGA